MANIRVLVVGGGGGSVNSNTTAGTQQGGGGGGGVIENNSYSITDGLAMTITVGVGGTSPSGYPSFDYTRGASSIFNDITAYGGGTSKAGQGTEGSGAGGIWNGIGYVNPTNGTVGQGYNGGAVGGGSRSSGGGGGGGDGQSAVSAISNGGVGYQSNISGTNTYYAGGGAGSGGAGGLGGGGNSGQGGTAGTGGGAGCAGDQQYFTGGSGVIVVRFLTADFKHYSSTLAYTATTDGAYTVLTFNTAGTGTFKMYSQTASGPYTDTFTTTNNWVCPATVISAIVECWGAGGSGGTRNSTGGGGGGGGGAYAKSNVRGLISGTSYDCTISGNASFGSNTVKAAVGASVGTNVTTGGAGGAVADCIYNLVAYKGGNGANAPGGGGGGGEGAGTTSAGGDGSGSTGGSGTDGGNGGNGATSNANGNGGSATGGGGGGAYRTSGTRTGGGGGAGQIKVTWSFMTSPLPTFFQP